MNGRGIAACVTSYVKRRARSTKPLPPLTLRQAMELIVHKSLTRVYTLFVHEHSDTVKPRWCAHCHALEQSSVRVWDTPAR